MAEEKLSLQELELRLKEQELKLKEAEVLAKKRDLSASRWFNPVVIGLFATALGLAGNVVVTTINNTNMQELERAGCPIFGVLRQRWDSTTARALGL